MGAIGPWQIAILVVMIAGYLLPGVIAFLRMSQYRWFILGLTVLGGWTFLGWIAALVWSLRTMSPLEKPSS
jgi:preprotein translocase subunit SecD